MIRDNQKSVFRKGLHFAALFCMLLMLFSIAVHASAKSDAMKAYDNYLKSQSNYPGFAVIYLNNDAVPDLVVGNKVFTYKSGKMQQLEYSYYAPSAYFKKKGVLIGTFAHGNINSLYTSDIYFKLNGAKFESFLTIESDTPKGKKTVYTYKDSNYKTISKAQCQSKLKKVVGTRKKTKIKTYENTAANRKKYLK